MCINCGLPDNIRCECESAQPFCNQCLNEDRCVEKMDAQCVVYHFDQTEEENPSNLTCLDLPNDSTIEEIVEAIDAKICVLEDCCEGGTPVNGKLLQIDVFDEDGTWTKPAGCTKILVKTVGGGGGSGGIPPLAVSEGSAASGGGAGGWSECFIDNAINPIGTTEAVIVGAGGSGGNIGNAYNGYAGTDSSFGTFSLVGGGQGGYAMVAGSTPLFMDGGIGGTCTIVGSWFITGGSGGAGGRAIRINDTALSGGAGGESVMGGGESISGPGQQLTPGVGGGGTEVSGESINAIPGAGGSEGVVIVYSYS